MKSIPFVLTVFLLTLALPGARGMEEKMATDLVIDFGSPASVQDWIVVNDGVMGGKSRGGFVLTDDHIVFSGVTNTDGGGFSSIRGPLPRGIDLSGATGIMLRVRASGTRTFKVDFRQQEPGRSRPLSYRADISLEDRPGWQDVRVPFGDFDGTWRGRLIPDATFVPGQATTVGLYISDGEDGLFRLEIDRIEAYHDHQGGTVNESD